MNLAGAFFKLIRYPNLIFIGLTQVLFYTVFLFLPGASPTSYQIKLTPNGFVLLMVASIFIAAAGYIINDYFDLNIDKINKPSKIIIEKIIRRRWAIFWHLALTVTGVLLSFWVGYRIGNSLLGLMNLLCALLLWVYSTTFKKKLLIGNIIISLLTAWVVLVLYFCELRVTRVFYPLNDGYQEHITRLFKVAILYGGFAFIISLVREVVKDVEDVQGDGRYGCTTMPIVWGIPAAKVFSATLLTVLIAALCIVQFYVLQLHRWWSALYCVLFILLPLLRILYKLYKANSVQDYHSLSTALKVAMLTGILSMLFFSL
ncbi:MAG: geranylgeranylglycerol-phosphate geranylgeranyltransferase [Williamsia sp.]|nr:geranylgeranylglycerol-phosphate geranylgeranyltransferase [Williamsia sp.]